MNLYSEIDSVGNAVSTVTLKYKSNDARIRKILTDYDMMDCNPKKQPFTRCHVASMAESMKNGEFMNDDEEVTVVGWHKLRIQIWLHMCQYLANTTASQ